MKSSEFERPNRYLPANKVWERYGVSSMTIWRWLHDERIGFPKPIYIGRFRYWNIAELEEWEARCELAKAS